MHAHHRKFSLPFKDTPTSTNDSLNVTVESDEETDSLNVTVESNDGSLYIPTPQRKVREHRKCVNYSIKYLLHGLETIEQVHQASESNTLLRHTWL